MDLERIEKMSCNEMADRFIDDCFYSDILKKKHEKEVEERALQLAKTKEAELFNTHKEEFQLEVLKQVQEEGIRKEGLKVSASSPLISETYTVDGIELNTSDFIPDSVQIDPLYEEKQLIKNAYSLEWQEQDKRTGKCKFVCIIRPQMIQFQEPKIPEFTPFSQRNVA